MQYKRLHLGVLLLGCALTTAHAQMPAPSLNAPVVMVPTLVMTETATKSTNISAAEAAYHVALYETRVRDTTSSLGGHFPKDSMQIAITTDAAHWLSKLEAQPIQGIQLDPFGQICVRAGRDSIARYQFDARLATRGLPLNDRAYTYLLAVMAFAHAESPAHLEIVERYLVSLDRLGSRAAYWQHMAHRELVHVYYRLGRSADVVRHGTRAALLLEDMDFADRSHTYEDAAFYLETVDALINQLHPRAEILGLDTVLLRAAHPPVASLAQNPEFAWLGAQNIESLQAMIRTGARIGTHGHDIVGNYWVNLPIRGAVMGDTAIPIANGQIHVVGFGSYTCPPCRTAITSLQRIQDRYPGIQVLYVTETVGSWSNRLVEPDVEAERLRAYYTQELNIRFPISIWKGVRKQTVDGGLLPEGPGPNLRHYPFAGKPNIVVLDGRGMIRRVYSGFSPDTEKHLAQLLDVLEREPRVASH